MNLFWILLVIGEFIDSPVLDKEIKRLFKLKKARLHFFYQFLHQKQVQYLIRIQIIQFGNIKRVKAKMTQTHKLWSLILQLNNNYKLTIQFIYQMQNTIQRCFYFQKKTLALNKDFQHILIYFSVYQSQLANFYDIFQLVYFLCFYFQKLQIQEEIYAFVIIIIVRLPVETMFLRQSTSDCNHFIENLLKKVQTETANRSIKRYVNQNIPKQSVQFFNVVQNQIVLSQNFQPIKIKEIEQKQPILRHSKHTIKFVASEPNTKRKPQSTESKLIQFQLLKNGKNNNSYSKVNLHHKKYASALQELNKYQTKLIPLFIQSQSKNSKKSQKQLKRRSSHTINTQFYIDSLRTKKKKIEEAFSSFIDPKIIAQNNKQKQGFKKKISSKQLINLQIVTNYDGEILPVKKSSRRLYQKAKLSQIPSYRIKTQTTSCYPQLPVNIKAQKPFQTFKTFKNGSYSLISKDSNLSNADEGTEKIKKSTKMVSILDLKSQKQNTSGLVSPVEKIKSKIFNLQDLVSSGKSRRIIQYAKKSKRKTFRVNQDSDQQ